MDRFARRIGRSAESPTAAIFRRVTELTEAGEDVIGLSVGEPDFEPPAHVVDAARRALEAGRLRYTDVPGLSALRRAIAADSERRRGLVHAPNEIVVSGGGKHALFNVAQALFEEGDEVVIPTPAWGSFAGQARLCGASPVFVACEESDGFRLDPDALARALSPRTRAVVLCTPNNPTGAVYERERLRALAEVLRGHPSWIVLDEIYTPLGYDGSVPASLLEVAPELRDRALVVDGVSKRYAMTGWRIGWLLAPRGVARACEAVQSQATSSVTTISQLAAIAALEGPQDAVAEMRDAFARRRELMIAGLGAIPGLRVTPTWGAFYLFVGVEALFGRRAGEVVLGDDVAVAHWLLEEARVATVPGSAFHAPGYLRFSYAVAPDVIGRACERIGHAVASLGGSR